MALRKRVIPARTWLCALAILCLGVSGAQAATIGPGIDAFTTIPGTLFWLDEYASILPFPPPPPVEMTSPTPTTGNTFLERLSSINAVPGLQAVDIELVALSLVSVTPIDIGGTQYHVNVDMSSPATPLTPGFLDIAPTGEFTLASAHEALFDISITPVGPPAPPIPLLGALPQTVFQFEGTGMIDLASPTPTINWDSLGLALLSTPNAPSFLFGPLEHRPAPGSPAAPPIPEPATLGLLGMGVIGIALRRRRSY